MTKTELMETYTAEQLADMVVELNEKDEQSKKIYEALQKDYEKIYKSYKEKNENSKEKELQSEVEKYRKAFEDAKKERDCRIAEYQKKIEEMEEYVDSLKCSVDRKKDAINQIDSIICELFGIAHNGYIYSDDFKELLREKSAVGKTIADFLPTEPIKVASMMINAEGEYEHNSIAKALCKEDKGTYRIFDIGELRQIAEHLLVYCNHNGEAGE